MGRQPTTRLQVSGYRFLMRRSEHALVRADVRMLDDPLRTQSLSLLVGAILAVIAVAGCAILAFLRPQGALGTASIVMAHDSGALFVRIDDTLHPVLNLASARLIAGAPADPARVSESVIAGAKRGPLMGIPGAPAVIGAPLTAEESGWTVCDAPASTTVIAGNAAPPGAVRVDAGHGVLVTSRADAAARTYLIYAGRRAPVDLRSAAVVRALHLDGVEPQRISRALFESVPETPGIAAPPIPDAGAPGALAGLPIGTVVRLFRAAGAEYYVVLRAGVQRIGEVAAELIRFTVAQPDREIRTVAADAIAAVPAVDDLPVRAFPDRLRPVDAPTLCAQWLPDVPGRHTNSVLWLGGSLPGDAPGAVRLAQADGDGPGVDAVLMPPGRSAYIRSAGLAGDGGRAGSLYLVDDLGVRFGVHDEQTAAHLGLSAPAVPAPWPLIALLPRGPELSRDRASVLRDGVPAP